MKKPLQHIHLLAAFILPHICIAAGFALLTFSSVDFFNTSLYLINYMAMKIDIIILCVLCVLSCVIVYALKRTHGSMLFVPVLIVSGATVVYSAAITVICALALRKTALAGHMLSERPYKLSIFAFAIFTVGAQIFLSVVSRREMRRKYITEAPK